MIKVTPVQPIGHTPTAAFVEHADRSKSGVELIDWPEYPPSPHGDWLREARKAAGLTLGEAARRAGISVSEWSGLETGSHTTDNAGWSEARLCLGRAP